MNKSAELPRAHIFPLVRTLGPTTQYGGKKLKAKTTNMLAHSFPLFVPSPAAKQTPWRMIKDVKAKRKSQVIQCKWTQTCHMTPRWITFPWQRSDGGVYVNAISQASCPM